jgi:hypothetical protein
VLRNKSVPLAQKPSPSEIKGAYHAPTTERSSRKKTKSPYRHRLEKILQLQIVVYLELYMKPWWIFLSRFWIQVPGGRFVKFPRGGFRSETAVMYVTASKPKRLQVL